MKPFYLILLLLTLPQQLSAQEICNNGIDDDANGLIDLNDPTCVCNPVTGTPSSLIPNPSFEDMDCCPAYFAELSCSQGWMQASDATSDYLHTCNLFFTSSFTTNLNPFPDGEAAAGAVITQDYKEYIGACLNSTMVAGTSYTLQMQIGAFGTDGNAIAECDLGPISDLPWTLFGTSSCSNLPFFGMDCPPSPQYMVLGSANVAVDGDYHTISITFTPTVNINAIAMGPGCTLPADYPPSFNACMPYAFVDNLIINESSSFTSGIDSTGTLCQNNLVLTGSAPTPGGTFQWYENGIAINGQTNANLNVSTLGLSDGTYQMVYTLNGECSVSEITVDPEPTINVDVNDGNICQGSSITLTATGASSYTWSPSSGLSATTGTNVTASPSATTTYTVTGTTNGCSGQATALVTVTNDVNVQALDQSACPGQPMTLTATGADSYAWSPATGLSATTGSSVISTPSSTTTYTVVGTVGSCTGSTTVTATINTLDITGFANPTQMDASDPTSSLTAEPIGNNYTWVFDDGTQLTGNQISYTFDAEQTEHSVLLIGTNAEGCIDSTRVYLNITNDPIFYVPNTFTPDGDEHNNIFQPVFTAGFDEHSFEMFIFNRWGELVFESHDATKGWDGTYHGKLVPTGTYSWTISFKHQTSDKRSEVQGHVTIFK